MGGLFQIRARAIKEESGFGLRQAGPEFEESRRRPPRNQQRIQNRHPGPQGVTVDPGGSTTPPQHGLQAGSAVDLGPFAATPSLLPQSGGGPSPRNLRPTPSPLVAMHSPSPPPPSPPSQGQNTEMGSMLDHYPVHLMPQDGVDAIPPPLQDPFPLTVVGQPQPFNAPRHLPETLGFLGTRGEIIPVDGGYTLVETTSVISSGLANRLRGPRRPKPASWVAGEMKNVTVAISKGGHGDFEEVELWMEIVPALGNGDFSLSLAAWMRINQVRDKHAAAFSDTNVPPVPYQPLSPQRTNTISNFDQAVYTNPTAGVDTIPMVVTDVTLQDSNLTNPMTVDSSRSGAYATSQNYQNQNYVMRPGQTSTPFLQHAFIPDPLHRPPDYGYGSQSGFTAPYSQGHLEQMSALFKTYPGSFGNVQEEFMPVPPQRLPEYGCNNSRDKCPIRLIRSTARRRMGGERRERKNMHFLRATRLR
ncbi:uncharacterized protein DNG_07578 [Cephalotrichum gorgonifer]|uniref:Uncharacterized protein n=1 Tax=Cephalotrichum gorgonifer TaxID=2041049 RepID=A0AAE8N3T1_9PEZI|nr:uncharacterized protein DNG_07578 [Cephalotrichum gorgonifer]